MKKWIALACALVMLFSLAACSGTPATPSGDDTPGAAAPEKGTFTVGFDQNFPPFG